MSSTEEKNPEQAITAKLSRWRWQDIVYPLLLLILMYFGAQYWHQRDALSGEAPIVVGTLLSGKTISLTAYRGKPVLVHFWASWCPICRFEQATIDALSEDYAVLTIASQSGSADEVQDYVITHQVKAPVLVDESGDIARLYAVRAFPTSFIIDEQGQIADLEVGYTSEWGLRIRFLMLSLFN